MQINYLECNISVTLTITHNDAGVDMLVKHHTRYVAQSARIV